MDFLNRLNENQTSAAMWNDGPLLVLAGPGSGKTATLTARVARLIKASPDESFKILCLTFTRKAAAEMRNRLITIIPDATSRVYLTTFHSFATDILRQHGSHLGYTPDFEIIEEAERVKFVREIINEHIDKFTRIVSADKALSALDFLFRNMTPNSDVSKFVKDVDLGKELEFLFIEYKQRLIANNCIDYASLLYFSEELLSSRGRMTNQLRSIYKYICVDEFQDTNVAQFKILRAIANERDANIFIVGDDDQVIYQWNGASPKRINDLGEFYDLTTIQLPENYRCPEEVVKIANSLIQCNEERSKNKQPNLPIKRNLDGESRVSIMAFDSQNNEVAGVASKVKSLLASAIKPKDIVILARNTKLLDLTCNALLKAGVKAFLQKRKSQFESAPMSFIVGVLKLAFVRNDEEICSLVAKALSDCFDEDILPDELIAIASGATDDYLYALSFLSEVSSGIPKDIQNAINKIINGDHYSFIVETMAYFDFLESQSEEGREQYADYPSERKVWMSIIDEIGGESEASRLSLGQLLQELALANKTPSAPEDSVACLTIHSSKGMEFDHVFLVGLAEDQLPSFQSKKNGDSSREMQEERRNCFVAITRAIETLNLSYATEYNGWSKKPSRFLHEMGLL